MYSYDQVRTVQLVRLHMRKTTKLWREIIFWCADHRTFLFINSAHFSAPQFTALAEMKQRFYPALVQVPWTMSVIQPRQRKAQWRPICPEVGRVAIFFKACLYQTICYSPFLFAGARVLLPSILAPYGLQAVPEWNHYCVFKRKINSNHFLHLEWIYMMPRLAPPSLTVINVIQENLES